LTLPAELRIDSVREPEGDLILCRDTSPNADKRLHKLIEADTGREICAFTAPETSRWSHLLWLNEREGLWLTAGHTAHVDLREGKVGEQAGRSRHADWGYPVHFLSDDRRQLFEFMIRPKASGVELHSIDLATGKVTEMAKDGGRQVNRHGVVPGGKYLHAGRRGF